MPDPTQPCRADMDNAWRRTKNAVDLVDQGRVDSVHQPPIDLARRIAEDEQDCDSDEQADSGVGPRPAEREAASTNQDRQRREAVGARMQAVGD